jgi:hypothetical protein
MDVKKVAIIVAGSALLVGIFVVLRDRAEPSTTEGAVRVEVSVRDGSVVGGPRRTEVRKGSRVVIVVAAAERDRVHLHGYDRYAPLEPGSPARLEFRASTAGSFDVELEERRLLLVTLDVR